MLTPSIMTLMILHLKQSHPRCLCRVGTLVAEITLGIR